MDRRLVVLALLAPAATIGAGRIPSLAAIASLLVSMAAVGWAVREGVRGWAWAMGPGAVVLALFSPGELVGYLACLLAGPFVAAALSLGRRSAEALLWGVVPYAAWIAFLAATGFQPFPAEMEEALEDLFRDAQLRGGPGGESLAEPRAIAGSTLEALSKIWPAMEAFWFAATVFAAWVLLRRWFSAGGFAPLGRFARFDVPDAVVGALIVGLALVLAGEGVAGSAAVSLGWNLVVATGLLYAVRGVAIQVHWMDRAGAGRWVRAGFFVMGVMVFLPVFAAAAAGLGLFDTWFDFRRIRDDRGGENPLSLLARSSGEDVENRE